MIPKCFTSLQQFVACLLISCLSASFLLAMPARPAGFVEEQPDGSAIHLHLEGDEFFPWLEDVKGYTVLKDRDWFVYGRRDETGRLVPSGLRVGKDNPARAGPLPRELPDPAFRNPGFDGPQQAGGDAASSGPATALIQGILPNLVVLLRFSDHATRSVPSKGDIDVLMNTPGGDASLAPTGSVRDIYLENSYGQLSLDSSVAYWVTLPNTEAYYANGNSGLTSRTHEALRSALDTLNADPSIDFTDYDGDSDGQIDAITFLHSGYAAEFGGTSADGASYTDRMWSHKWGIGGGWTSSEGVRVTSYHISPAIWGTSGNTIGRIGVICHETGHFLGLPDLYDGNDSDSDGRSGSGIGSYGMMANSWGFDGSQYYPPHMSAWSKASLGWMNPTVIDTPGTYSLTQAETSASTYRIDLGYATGEYLLIENRQPVGSDSAMPQGGLAIFHIDESASYTTEGFPGQSGWPTNGNHYCVALLQADGGYDLERGLDRGDRYDVYRAGGVSEIGSATSPSTDGYQGGNVVVTNNRIFNISASGSTMTFDFQVVGAATAPNAPTSLAAFATSYDQISLSWSDQSSDETGFKVERDAGAGWIEIATLGANIGAYTDTGLAPSTTFTYRVRAFNSGGNSVYSNSSAATTQSPPPPPAAPSAATATAFSDTQIRIGWSDNAGDEDGFYVDRSLDAVVWDNAIASVAIDSQSYTDSGLSGSTDYHYRVRASSSWGTSAPSNTVTATTDSPLPFEFAYADQDWAVSGSVSGTYTATLERDGVTQTISERESGGRPSRRHSFLDHRWRFSNVRGGLTVTLFVEASAPVNGENDDFEFQYSLNGGNSWLLFASPLVVENGSAPGTVKTTAFPAGSKGEIYVRVIDTDDTGGNRAFDSVSVEQLQIRTDIDPNDFPPAAPSSVVATDLSSSFVSVVWQDNATNELGFEIWRSTDESSYTIVGSAAIDAESFTDTTAAPATTYTYRVSGFTPSFEAFSADSNSVTTPDGIALTGLSGGKSKGKIYVDLTWDGGASLASIDIYRSTNGSGFFKVASTANNGSYSDSTGLKGGNTLVYRVQSADGAILSNERVINF